MEGNLNLTARRLYVVSGVVLVIVGLLAVRRLIQPVSIVVMAWGALLIFTGYLRVKVFLKVSAVAVLALAAIGWQLWRERQEMLRHLDRQGKQLQCMKGEMDIHLAEMNCAIELTNKGQQLSQAARYCHQQHAAEWQGWAKSCPDLAKQMVENHAIVEATK